MDVGKERVGVASPREPKEKQGEVEAGMAVVTGQKYEAGRTNDTTGKPVKRTVSTIQILILPSYARPRRDRQSGCSIVFYMSRH